MRWRRNQQGASALELAFIAPSFLFLIFFTIQGSLYFYGRSVAQQAAREGVSQLRLTARYENFADQKPLTQAFVVNFAKQVGREALLNPQAELDYDQQRDRVSVAVTGEVITLVPLLDLTVTQKASGTVERFVAPPGSP